MMPELVVLQSLKTLQFLEKKKKCLQPIWAVRCEEIFLE